MLDIKSKIEKNPLKWYLVILLLISSFFAILFLITFLVSAKPIISTLTIFFNTTNVSTTLNYFSADSMNDSIIVFINNSSVNGTIINSSHSNFNFDSLSTIIALLGAFGVLTYLFYSIKEGSFTDEEDKKIVYAFTGSFSIIFFLVIIVGLSFIYGFFPSSKTVEIGFLTLIFAFVIVIAIIFKFVMDVFKDNYENRMKIINFLEIRDVQPIISINIDNQCRWLIAMKESISLYTFLLILFIPIFGYLIGLNILSVAFLEFMVLILFAGFSRLTRLFENNCNIELRNQSERSTEPLRILNKIFILYWPKNGSIEILTEDNKRVRILKELVYSVQDNEITVFKGKEIFPPPSIRSKRIIRFVLSMFIDVIIYQLVILHALQSKDFTIVVFSLSTVFSFCLVGWYSNEIDELVNRLYTEYFLPTTTLGE